MRRFVAHKLAAKTAARRTTNLFSNKTSGGSSSSSSLIDHHTRCISTPLLSRFFTSQSPPTLNTMPSHSITLDFINPKVCDLPIACFTLLVILVCVLIVDFLLNSFRLSNVNTLSVVRLLISPRYYYSSQLQILNLQIVLFSCINYVSLFDLSEITTRTSW